MDGWRGEGITGPVKVEYGRPVWLQLDIAFPPPSRRRSTADGIPAGTHPRRPQTLDASHDGAWYGLLHRVEFRDGASAHRIVVEQLVPAALRPATDRISALSRVV